MLLGIFCLLFFDRCKNGSLFSASVLYYSTAALRGKWILYADVPYFWFNFLKTYWFCSSCKSLSFYIGQGSGKRQANSSWFSSTLVLLFHKEREKKSNLSLFFWNYEERKDFVRKLKLFLGSLLFLIVLFFLFLTWKMVCGIGREKETKKNPRYLTK